MKNAQIIEFNWKRIFPEMLGRIVIVILVMYAVGEISLNVYAGLGISLIMILWALLPILFGIKSEEVIEE